MKRIRRLMVVMALVVSAMSMSADAAAAPWPAHHQQIPVSWAGCNVTFSHGNIWGVAYSKVQNWSNCGTAAYVQVTAWNGYGLVPGAVCGFRFPDQSCWVANNGQTVQSDVFYANIVGSTLRLCNVTNSSCKTFTFSGV